MLLWLSKILNMFLKPLNNFFFFFCYVSSSNFQKLFKISVEKGTAVTVLFMTVQLWSSTDEFYHIKYLCPIHTSPNYCQDREFISKDTAWLIEQVEKERSTWHQSRSETCLVRTFFFSFFCDRALLNNIINSFCFQQCTSRGVGATDYRD